MPITEISSNLASHLSKKRLRILEDLSSQNDLVREEAAEWLGKKHLWLIDPLTAPESEQLLALARYDVYQTVRIAAAETLYLRADENIKLEMLKIIRNLLQYPGLNQPHHDGANLVRARAIEAIKDIRDSHSETLQALNYAIDDSFLEVRTAARDALRMLSSVIEPEIHPKSASFYPHEAIKLGDLASLKKYIRNRRSNIELRDENGRTLLLAAMLITPEEGKIHQGIIRFLIENSANLNAKTDIPQNEWMGEEEYEYINVSPIHISYLIAKGLLPRDPEIQTFFSILFRELLLNKKVNLDAQFSEGVLDYPHHLELKHVTHSGREFETGFNMENITLLHMLVLFKDMEHIESICRTGRANLNAEAQLFQNKHYMNHDPLISSDEINQHENGIEIIQHVRIAKVPITLFRYSKVTPIQLAAQTGSPKIVDFLIRAGSNPLQTNSIGIDSLSCTVRRIEELTNPPETAFLEDNYFENIDEEITDLLELARILNVLKKRSLRPLIPHLFLGENDFSFTEAFLFRYARVPGLAKALIATEYSDFKTLITIHDTELNTKAITPSLPCFESRLNRLRQRGVHVQDKVDATKLSELCNLPKRNPCIYFNFPHDHSQPHERTLPLMLAKFFAESARIQIQGNRIFMALPCFPDDDMRRYYHAFIYDIFSVSAAEGYVLKAKRPFGHTRYKGYEHRITGKNKASKKHDDYAAQYIFEKTNLSFQEILSHPTYGPETEPYELSEDKKCELIRKRDGKPLPTHYFVLKNIPFDTDYDSEEELYEKPTKRKPGTSRSMASPHLFKPTTETHFDNKDEKPAEASLDHLYFH